MRDSSRSGSEYRKGKDVRATLETVSCGELTAVYRKDSDTGIVELVSWIVDASSVL